MEAFGSVKTLRRARSTEAFIARPEGGYFGSRRFVSWCVDRGLHGHSVWGRPDTADFSLFERLAEAELRAERHASVVDARYLEWVERSAVEALVSFMRRRERDLAAHIERQALVRGPGAPGTFVEGIYRAQAPLFEFEVFEDVEAALRWLGRADARAAASTLDALVDAARPELLRRVRERIEADLSAATCEIVARSVGLSARTLQRRLVDLGTSFSAERALAQVERAQRLLEPVDVQISAVALEVGCSSPQQLSRLFRRVTGETPSAWRRARAAG